ncbi:MAG: hypothetical protein HY051_01615 [Candidatus Aenigmarchaeota archaeon]|nr:hypothetical protein [Candidatus Aenigmarchaeota archaeon]
MPMDSKNFISLGVTRNDAKKDTTEANNTAQTMPSTIIYIKAEQKAHELHSWDECEHIGTSYTAQFKYPFIHDIIRGKSCFGIILPLKSLVSKVGNIPCDRSLLREKDVFRLHTDSDVCKGNTDIPEGATHGTTATFKLVI